jgi:hypothetical protein
MHGVLLEIPADASPTPWAVIALGILTLIYVVFVRPQQKKRRKDPLAQMPGKTLLSQHRSMERDMTALLVEYEQMMRTMTAQLETRVAKLELLIGDADERIAALRAAEQKAATRPPEQQVPEHRQSAMRPADPRHADARSSDLTDVPTSGPKAGESSRLAPPAKDDSGAGFEIDPEPPADEEPATAASPHADVYALADEGLTYRQIAQRLDRQYGEIELILALRSKDAPPAAVAESPRGADAEIAAVVPAANAGRGGKQHGHGKQRKRQH